VLPAAHPIFFNSASILDRSEITWRCIALTRPTALGRSGCTYVWCFSGTNSISSQPPRERTSLSLPLQVNTPFHQYQSRFQHP